MILLKQIVFSFLFMRCKSHLVPFIVGDGCEINNGSHLIEAYAGHEDLMKVKSTREIGKMIIHAHYDEHSAANDIALVALKKNLKLGRSIKRIMISPTFPQVQRAKVAGWGIVEEGMEDITTKLKAVDQKIRSEKICSRIEDLDPGMFCAGSTQDHSKRPANGDSGSALVEGNVALGIVSFRLRSQPGLMVYTNVTYYYEWIVENAQTLFCEIQKNYDIWN